ncbi:hypothetical protein EJ06DRAFT_48914 [Trichodelitschia bisporula]|uniref:Uncharacterized protein n=1 Tax=Trichodelitschia bisporula TaxID=703511 RepID=A0A6G1HTJ4_9PEZI|nr:hypothetical protein EJ06DRAFT_48914 [Trichodelitschia bisporula]
MIFERPRWQFKVNKALYRSIRRQTRPHSRSEATIKRRCPKPCTVTLQMTPRPLHMSSSLTPNITGLALIVFALLSH